MSSLVAENLTLSVDQTVLLQDASLDLEAGCMAVLLGPNGAGKSSLMRALAGGKPATSGTVQLNGADLGALAPTQRARELVYLPQTRTLAWPNRVRDIVSMGRYAHGGGLGRLSADDAVAVDAAMQACAITELADREAQTLSGGEQARMHVARALAAQAGLILADEPTAALDPRHQIGVMELFKQFAKEGGGVLLVLHDVELACAYADKLIFMKGGRIIADGAPTEIVTPGLLEEVYDTPARVEKAENRLQIDFPPPR